MGKLFNYFKGNKQDNNDANSGSSSTNVNQPKDKARRYNLIIVDESGSMGSLYQATLSGINETIDTIRKAQNDFKDSQDHRLTLVTFDSGNETNIKVKIDNQSITKVKKFKDYAPCGCTPLFDAIGISVTSLHDCIKDDEDATAVVTILTDGMENSSKEWDVVSVKKLIDQMKEEGWSFSYMGSDHDVQRAASSISVDNVVEFSHTNLGTSSTWEREQSSRQSYYEKINCMYNEENHISREEKLERKRRFAKEYYGQRVSPMNITHLNPNEIFVFGSSADGSHGGGAAGFAVRNFGAVYGQGEGLQGQSYAIPTTNGFGAMAEAVHRFIDFAYNHPELRFLVTNIGCGNAGFNARDVAPLFRDAIKLENIALPQDFWMELGLRMF